MNEEAESMIVYGEIEAGDKKYRDVTLGAPDVMLGLTATDTAISMEIEMSGTQIVVGLDATTFWAMIALLSGSEAADVAKEHGGPLPLPIVRADQKIDEADLEQAVEDVESTIALFNAGAEFEAALRQQEQEGDK